MKIEFDPDKAVANPIKHESVTFEEAKTALLDPYTLTHEDKNIINEQRFITLGMGSKRANINRHLDFTSRNSPLNLCMESQLTPKKML